MFSAIKWLRSMKWMVILGVFLAVMFALFLRIPTQASWVNSPASFIYPGFGNTNGLSLVGSASHVGSIMQLTSSTPCCLSGSAWQLTKQDIEGGFETDFTFRINNLVGAGGDGFAFVIQNGSDVATGNGGCGMGYNGMANSLVVEFDTYHNGTYCNWIQDPNDNHISIHSGGTLTTSVKHTPLDYAIPGINLSDGEPYVARIKYVPGLMSVFLEDMATPVLTKTVDLSTLLDLDRGNTWVGFAAGTGTSSENHEILEWNFKATQAPTTDFIPVGLEVTQAIQNMRNEARLAAFRRTYVRFYVRAQGDPGIATAQLRIENDAGEQVTINPINGDKGCVNILPNYNRNVLDNNFLFEIPDGYLSGEVRLTAVVNPSFVGNPCNYTEIDNTNNTHSTQVTFEVVPTIHLMMYRVPVRRDDLGANYSEPLPYSVISITNQLVELFPISRLSYEDHVASTVTVTTTPKLDDLSSLPCSYVNDALDQLRAADTKAPDGARFVGIVDSQAMRIENGIAGCARLGGMTASSFVQMPTIQPADLRAAAHELGHAWGRGHVNYCDALGGIVYPTYPFWYGSIGFTGLVNFNFDYPSYYYGFNINNHTIYNPLSYYDIMTYCSNSWISPYTYENLMDYFQANPVYQAAARDAAGTPLLQVIGNINPTTSQVDLLPIFAMTDTTSTGSGGTGNYAIVLYNASGAELARHSFEPEPDLESNSLYIRESVPYREQATRIEIEGPNGVVLKTIQAGAATPEITLNEPNGGEVISGGNVKISWTASDPDGEPLTYLVLHSPDNGLNWHIVAQNVLTDSIEIDTSNTPAGPQSLFAVLASDGVHTGRDDSDAPFEIINHIPVVEITTPTEDLTTTLAISQTLGLRGYAYDADTGSMDANSLEWYSSIDGFLGNGDNLTVTGLQPGTHTVTFRADDGAGGMASDTIQVVVVKYLSNLPPKPDELSVSPKEIVFRPANGIISETLAINNLNVFETLNWEAVANEPWLKLDALSGVTPQSPIIYLVDDDLEPGEHSAIITFSSSDLPGTSVDIQVRVYIAEPTRIYLPIVLQR